MMKEGSPSVGASCDASDEVVEKFGLHWIIFVRPFAVILALWCALGIAVVTVREGVPRHLWEALSAAFFVLIIGLVVFSCLQICGAALRVATTSLTVYRDRMVFRSGATKRWSVSEPLSEVTVVTLERPLLGQVLDFGTVRFEARGVSRLVAPGIARASSLAELVTAMSEERRSAFR